MADFNIDRLHDKIINGDFGNLSISSFNNYKSPIDLITNDLMAQIQENTDNKIMCEVIQQIGVVVDKEEMLKALAYDRKQYEKGFADARARFEPKHGEWVDDYDDNAGVFFRRGWRCSVCNYRQSYGKPDFCMRCGAKMDGAIY